MILRLYLVVLGILGGLPRELRMAPDRSCAFSGRLSLGLSTKVPWVRGNATGGWQAYAFNHFWNYPEAKLGAVGSPLQSRPFCLLLLCQLFAVLCSKVRLLLNIIIIIIIIFIIIIFGVFFLLDR